jgi:hypothetical protein
LKFPEFNALIAKKNLKLHCCDRCNRAEWVEQTATVSFCRCGTRRRPPTKAELEQFKQQIMASAAAPASRTSGEA